LTGDNDWMNELIFFNIETYLDTSRLLFPRRTVGTLLVVETGSETTSIACADSGSQSLDDEIPAAAAAAVAVLSQASRRETSLKLFREAASLPTTEFLGSLEVNAAAGTNSMAVQINQATDIFSLLYPDMMMRENL
jgi:hypothetical protein